MITNTQKKDRVFYDTVFIKALLTFQINKSVEVENNTVVEVRSIVVEHFHFL